MYVFFVQTHVPAVYSDIKLSYIDPATSVGKKNKRKKPQKKGSSGELPVGPEPEIDGPVIQLLQSLSSDQPVNPETPNSEAWRPPAALSVGPELVPITYNPPTVTALELPSRLMPGFPVLANVDLTFADSKACEWEWMRLPPGQGSRLLLSTAAPLFFAAV